MKGSDEEQMHYNKHQQMAQGKGLKSPTGSIHMSKGGHVHMHEESGHRGHGHKEVEEHHPSHHAGGHHHDETHEHKHHKPGHGSGHGGHKHSVHDNTTVKNPVPTGTGFHHEVGTDGGGHHPSPGGTGGTRNRL